MTTTTHGRPDARHRRGRRAWRVAASLTTAVIVPIGWVATAAPSLAFPNPNYDSRFCPSNSAVVVSHTDGSFQTFRG